MTTFIIINFHFHHMWCSKSEPSFVSSFRTHIDAQTHTHKTITLYYAKKNFQIHSGTAITLLQNRIKNWYKR
jgi:hypothetical protein